MNVKTIAITVALALLGADALAGATVAGTIKLDGKPPADKTRTITKDQHVCGEGQRVIDPVTITGEGLLADVVVYVAGPIDGVEAPAPPDGGYQLIQKGCRFNPSVSYVPKGETLTIMNQDPLAHNIHAYELIGRARRDLINFAQPAKGHTRAEVMKPRRGNIVQLTCDIHDFMSGWIFVPDNPFATTSTDGKFKIAGIPAGARTLKAFHPIFGEIEAQVDLKDGETANVDLTFAATK